MYAGVWYYNKHYGCQPMRSKKNDRYRRELKSSNRLRPRAEWLPVILPDQLRIIERSQWQQVQRQLTSNITFSQRNTKHFYLLRGLLTCGGCGAAYVGTPCHDKFYYRCSSVCRKVPTIRDSRLDEVVWSAVEEAVLNPSIISEQVAKYQEREEANAHQLHNESDQIERDMQKLANEESRVLEAYRMGIVSPSQLGQELEKVNLRKNALRNRKAHLVEQPKQSTFATLRKSVTDYCRQAAERLKSFTLEERQQFLRLIINRVVFEGAQVRIKAILPISQVGTEGTWRAGIDTGEKAIASIGRFASMMTNHYGRNTVEDYYPQSGISEGDNFIDHVNFELFRKLPEKPFSILSEEGLELVRLLKQKQGDPTLRELCDQLREERGVEIGLSSMSRALRKLNLSPARRGPRPKQLKRAA